MHGILELIALDPTQADPRAALWEIVRPLTLPIFAPPLPDVDGL